ncbi:MAG: hypothetical protein DRP15_00560 [Candidatus Aenigmatarchaeota archaeon]|nr:MAG: hypothetical protein DRP15_00560 [Candidatus Aenigmarchaeota archaeon]
MNKERIVDILKDIVNDRGIPRSIRNSLEESLKALDGGEITNEKIANITSILDEASNDPNISFHSRTKIWNAISIIEELSQQE